jgi:hypothetical protein
MDNFQKLNNFINIASSQTFRYLVTLKIQVFGCYSENLQAAGPISLCKRCIPQNSQDFFKLMEFGHRHHLLLLKTFT